MSSQRSRHPINHKLLNRRTAIRSMAAAIGAAALPRPTLALANGILDQPGKKVQNATENGLKWLASKQTRLGNWDHNTYPTAITALAGTALICSGSTTTQGPYAKHIRSTIDYLMTKCRSNGLIGDPQRDHRYTYGHGFAMLLLSQVLGEEEDIDRREELADVLERAVNFSVSAQTDAGGWGYVSAKDNDFDEGSTTITQVQGLRGCRNAGIVVPKAPIERAKQYIYKCQNDDGGISYSTQSLGTSRPAITTAALAALYNAGDYESEHVPKMWLYCKKNLHNLGNDQYGHWHYTYLYYSQVVYRQGPETWNPFRDKLNSRLVAHQKSDGSWEGNVSPVYATACNLIMLQIDYGYLPIYQR